MNFKDIEEQSKTIDDQQESIDELIDSVRALEEKYETQGNYYVYNVVRGDTLGMICKKLGIDYRKYKSVILELNHIIDENVIIVGQTLVFPQYMVVR